MLVYQNISVITFHYKIAQLIILLPGTVLTCGNVFLAVFLRPFPFTITSLDINYRRTSIPKGPPPLNLP